MSTEVLFHQIANWLKHSLTPEDVCQALAYIPVEVTIHVAIDNLCKYLYSLVGQGDPWLCIQNQANPMDDLLLKYIQALANLPAKSREILLNTYPPFS